MKAYGIVILVTLMAGIMVIAGCSTGSTVNQMPSVQSSLPPTQEVTSTVSATTMPLLSTTPAIGATKSGSRMVQIILTSQNIQFDKKILTAPAGSNVIMAFVNNDAGVPHNFALYTDSSAAHKIFIGDLVTGVKTVTYEFDAPPTPGNYYFRCDVHPTIMYGTFAVT